MHPVVFFHALRVKIRDEATVRDKEFGNWKDRVWRAAMNQFAIFYEGWAAYTWSAARPLRASLSSRRHSRSTRGSPGADDARKRLKELKRAKTQGRSHCVGLNQSVETISKAGDLPIR
jgi:hypothetical protein